MPPSQYKRIQNISRLVTLNSTRKQCRHNTRHKISTKRAELLTHFVPSLFQLLKNIKPIFSTKKKFVLFNINLNVNIICVQYNSFS